MARQNLIIVNASNVMNDAEITGAIPAMQKWIDDLIMPAWGGMVTDVQLSFAPMADIPNLPDDAWCMFVNRHSQDASALGWHTQEGQKVFGRMFAGDCKLYGLDPFVDLTHEIAEMMGDPTAEKVFQISADTFAAFELCDAVEADEQAISVDGVKCSNFVLPAYFSNAIGRRYDYLGNLHGPCPTLTEGGYMSIYSRGEWGMVQADRRATGLMGRRAAMNGFRRMMRKEPGHSSLQFGTSAAT